MRSNSRPLVVALAAAGLFGGLGCGGSSAAESARVPDESIRLGDLLGVASIESPVTAIPAARTLDELGDVPRETILAEDFEAFDMKEAGWRASRQAEVAEVGDGHAFRLNGSGGSRYGWVVPAEPSTHYVFERSVRSTSPLDVDFAVVEASDSGRIGIGGPFANHYMAGRGLALKIHYPKAPEPDGSWQRGSVSIFATPETRALAVVVRPTISQVEAAGAEGEAWFDDIHLERVDPTPEQTIALLKARAPADGADPGLGIEKYGQFPPLGEVGVAHGPADDNYSYRYALYAPPPTDLRFKLRIPTGASLSFAASLSRETRPGNAAKFEVIVRSEDQEETIWSRTIAAVAEDWRWHEARVDLARYEGLSIELVLRTRAEEGHPHPVWGNPVVDVPPVGDEPRNVILIAVDTLRADRMSCYGYSKETTPNLDALAADGVRFDQVATNCNWTCPSFASIFTGAVPSRHGVFSYGPRTPLPAGFETIAERFRANGWATHAIAYKPPLYDGGFEQGFDVAFNVPREAVRGEDNLAEALEWLEANADRRNFLFLHFNDPHQPFTQPEPFDRRFGVDPAEHGIELPHSIYQKGGARTEEQRDVMRGLYDGEVAYVDDRIGAFLDALKARGLYDDAVIGFVSDHGEQLWEHGTFGHGPTFSRDSIMLHDEVVRVPLIVKPGIGDFARGAVVPSQVRGFDVMPTLLELAGIPVADELDAESLVSMLSPDAGDAPDRIAVIETSGPALALRNRRWKYVLRYTRGIDEALFDLRADPGEKEDVAEGHPDVVEELRVQVLEYLLLRRPGHYLVAIGDGSETSHAFRVGGATAAGVFFGIPGRIDGESAVFEGDSRGPLIVACSLDGPGPFTVADAAPSRRYREGDLGRLLRDPVPGLHLFDGPPRAAALPEARPTMDARQLRTLRALGYVDDDSDEDDGR